MKDNVSVAFELMLAEIKAEISALNARGASLFQQSEYLKARSLTANGEALTQFQGRVETLQEEWLDSFSEETNDITPNEAVRSAIRTIQSGKKSLKTVLLVAFPDGFVIAEPKASKTFALTLNRIGFEQVSKLGIVVNGEPLIADVHSSRYNDTQVGRVFVRTHSSTATKRTQLEDVSNRLKIGLEVSII